LAGKKFSTSPKKFNSKKHKKEKIDRYKDQETKSLRRNCFINPKNKKPLEGALLLVECKSSK
jgi:hypothetical protein